MNIARLLQHALLMLLLLAATAGMAAVADTNRTSCVAEEERLELLRQRLGAQEKTRELLQALRGGEALPGTTLAQLFVVDLADEEAVRRRVQELVASDSRRTDNESVTGCLRLAAEFDTVATGLRTVQADVSVMRLAVLRLPATRRMLAVKTHELAVDLAALYRSEAEHLDQLATRLEAAERTLSSGEPEAAASDQITTSIEVDPVAMAAFSKTVGRITTLRNQSARLLAAAQHPNDESTAHQQAEVLTLWRDILDSPLHLTAALLGSTQASFASKDGLALETRRLGDERQRALLQVRLRHIASLLRADLQQERYIPHTTGGVIGLGQDLWREAREIPLHLAMPILAGALQLAAREHEAWRSALPELWNALLFGLAAWAALQLGRRSTRLLARAHDFIIRTTPGRGRLDWLGNLLRILTPFTPWLLAWLVIDGVLHIADIDTGIVAQWLVPLAHIYILFQLLRLLIDSAGRLLASASGSYVHDQSRLTNDAQRSALLVAALLFLQGIVAGSAGAALITALLEPVFWAVAWLAFGWALRHNGHLAVDATTRHLDALGFALPGTDALRKVLTHRYGWLLMPLATLTTLLTASARLIHEELLHFDAYRRLVLRSVRLRIAAEEVAPTAHHRNEVPADYRRLFQGHVAEAPDIPVNDDIQKRFQSMVDEWSGDRRDENSVAIIGDPGSGKGFLLDALHVPDGVRVCHLTPDKRLQTKEQFVTALATALEESLPDGLDSLLAQDAQRTPTLLIIDDAHRLFLTRVGGLDAWRTLLSAVNLPLEHIFWCVTLGAQPWIYLSDVFGSRYQFREVLKLRRWGMDDIRSLILTRHARADYALRFEDVLLGAHGMETSANLQSVEQRFFGLLWDSSRGNPGLALMLWQKSIALAAKSTLVAGTPPAPSFSPAGFSDSGLFVLATVARHGAISTTEIIQATDLPPAAVSHALKIAQDDDVLVQHDGLHALQLEKYYPLVSHLTAKNLLHE